MEGFWDKWETQGYILFDVKVSLNSMSIVLMLFDYYFVIL